VETKFIYITEFSTRYVEKVPGLQALQPLAFIFRGFQKLQTLKFFKTYRKIIKHKTTGLNDLLFIPVAVCKLLEYLKICSKTRVTIRTVISNMIITEKGIYFSSMSKVFLTK